MMGLLPFFWCNLKQLTKYQSFISTHADNSDPVTMGTCLENSLQRLFNIQFYFIPILYAFFLIFLKRYLSS